MLFRYLASSELICYLHPVSPVKVSSFGKCKYFFATLQTSEGEKNAVCFSPEKRTVFVKHEAKRSPVKISRFRINSKYGKEDVIIEQLSKVIPVSEEVGFQCTEVGHHQWLV